nr:alpha/beta hydrolase fold domain-containing protein [Flavihumibacter rivuli]
MDIYKPSPDSNNGKLILYVHGGGWYTGSKTEAAHWAKELQGLGHSAVCLDYALANKSPDNCYPRKLMDIEKAIAFMKWNEKSGWIQKRIPHNS